MLDFEQQANQAQALASLDEDWHLLEGECTTFAIFLLHSLCPLCIFDTRAHTYAHTQRTETRTVASMLEIGEHLVKTCLEVWRCLVG